MLNLEKKNLQLNAKNKIGTNVSKRKRGALVGRL